MNVDRVIRGGQVLDGTGRPPFGADIAVHKGRIAAVGRLEGVEAREIVDATPFVVAPGFVDLHSHGDLLLAWPSDERLDLLEGRLAQGITTEVVGNCGLGVAPLFGNAADLVRDITGWMTPARFLWSWNRLSEYLDHLEQIGLPMNVGALVPHGALRLGAVGPAPGETDAGARAKMETALEGALEEGAFGMSAGLIYPPGTSTSTEELVQVARGLKRHDAVLTCHIRGSSETLVPAVEELLRIGWEAGVRVHHSHAEAVGKPHWSKLEYFLELEEKATSEGIRVSRDMFPYTAAATMMLAIFPPWSLEGGLPRLLERLHSRAARRRIADDIDNVTPEWPPWREGGWPHNLVRAVGWEAIQIASVGSNKNRGLEGVSLAELGRRTETSPFDAICDLMLEENGNIGQFVLDISGDEGLRCLISRPDVVFITDANDYGKGKPHPAAYGSFPRVLGRYVREQALIDLPAAVRRMSLLPATILGIKDRGTLRVGAWADVVVFDPLTVTDLATLSDPRRKAEGIEMVLVNGEVVCRRGKLTGSLPGRVLRRNL